MALDIQSISSDEALYRARWTTETRKQYLKDHPENFAGPGGSFPIRDASDVGDAWGLAGHADDPDAVRSKIKSIAKRLGLESGLPDTAKEDEKEPDRSQVPDSQTDTPSGLIIRSDGNHDAFSGKHTHAHPAFGAQGDDDTHEHEHEHNNDADHHHSHSTEKSDAPDILRSLPTETSIFAPILRIDRAKREVVVRATAEDLDSYNTVIGYEASKEAFSRWRGNIREMHDPTKAVGRAIKWEPKDDTKEIELVLRVSRGAEDTWQKCLDGTLAGASIGARNGKWGKREWKGKEVPFLERYDLVEVSLVDNPSCPGCDVKVVRADGMATEVLDFSEDEQQPSTPTPEVTRAGARVSAGTKSSMHKSRDLALQSLREQMANCSCDECQAAVDVLDPDGDGDIDIIPSLDTDNDSGGSASGNGSGDGIMKAVQTEITRHLSPVITRMNGIAARLSTIDLPTVTTTQVPDELTKRFETLEQRLTGLDDVRSLLSEVKGLAEKSNQLAELIAAQPQPGGPIVNSAVLRQAQIPQPDPVAEDVATVARLAKAGILNKDQQVNAVLYLQKQQAQNGRR